MAVRERQRLSASFGYLVRPVNDPQEERLAKNEAMFRTLNENIVGIATHHGGDEHPYEFVCECATSGCFERITLTLREYERVRGDGTHFLLVPGHEDIEIEQVIAAHEKYVVVEKDGVAGLVADAENPRI